MSEKTLPMTGGCLCGAVRYEATELPSNVIYCHCQMCQRWSGSAMVVAARFPREAVTFTQGQPNFYKSSEIAERGCCTNCGTSIVFRYVGLDRIHICVGTLDHPEDAPPKQHLRIESKVPWLHIDDDLPRFRSEEGTSTQEAKAAIAQDGE